MTEEELKTLLWTDHQLRYDLVCELLEECILCGCDIDRHGLICNRCYFDGYVPLPWVEREAMRLKKEINDRELEDIQRGS